jgi:hypothetical protein
VALLTVLTVLTLLTQLTLLTLQTPLTVRTQMTVLPPTLGRWQNRGLATPRRTHLKEKKQMMNTRAHTAG